MPPPPTGTTNLYPSQGPYSTGTTLPPPPISPPVTQQQQLPQPNYSQQQQDSRIPIPPIPNDFEEINNLSEEQLKDLLDDKVSFKFDEFFDNLQYVKTINNLYKELRNANLNIAKSSIEKVCF
jgi:soluble cytochrome b562